MCKEVTGAHAAPRSAEEPPPAFVQPSVERSISLPPAACLAAARSNFLCIVPITAPPFPAHPARSVHHTARLPMPQRLRPTSLLRKCPCECSHASQCISLMLCAPLCSSLQRAVSHPKVFVPLCPPRGCNQRGGMETSRPAQGPGTDARLCLKAMAVVVPRCLLAAALPQRNILAQQGGSTRGKGTGEFQKQVLGNTLQSHEWKITPLGASGSGWGLQRARPSQHVCPAGTQHTCAHGVPWGEHIPATRRVHLWSRACAHGPACPAVPIMQTPMHTHGCMAARARCAGTPAALPACAYAQGQSQAPLCCAGMLGMEPQGAGVPSAIHSLGMLELASCRHVCVLYLPVTGRALGAGLQFVQIIIQVVTKPGMSKQLSSRGAHPECTRTRARLQPGSGAVDTGRQSTPAVLGCAGEHKRSIACVVVTPTSQSGGFAWHRGSPWQMQRAGVVPAPRQCPVAGSLCLDTNILAVGTLQQAATQQARCSARHPSRGSNQK